MNKTKVRKRLSKAPFSIRVAWFRGKGQRSAVSIVLLESKDFSLEETPGHLQWQMWIFKTPLGFRSRCRILIPSTFRGEASTTNVDWVFSFVCLVFLVCVLFLFIFPLLRHKSHYWPWNLKSSCLMCGNEGHRTADPVTKQGESNVLLKLFTGAAYHIHPFLSFLSSPASPRCLSCCL